MLIIIIDNNKYNRIIKLKRNRWINRLLKCRIKVKKLNLKWNKLIQKIN